MGSSNASNPMGLWLLQRAQKRDRLVARVRVRVQDKPKQDIKGRKRQTFRRNRLRWQTVDVSKPAGILDYKNATMLRRHISAQGRILPRRFNHLSAKQQRQMARSVKRARNMCLIATVRRRR
uniref:Small ribosomal subunit protein bS18c n=1 Tax=Chloroparvula japonica TaxID=1411623 RepID=A0A4D6C3B2_9CHLO|nr:ribosomal protein S18 [Chloroparvula japonica]QBX98150.1 ribosomal protein S18 [Chloroparvula japonica]